MVQENLEIEDGFAHQERRLREKPWWRKRRTNVVVTEVGYGVVKMARRAGLVHLQGFLSVEKVN